MQKISTIDFSKLMQIVQKQFPQILIAYVFGSAKNGKLKTGSDIDFAILLSSGYDKLLEFKIAVFLEEQLQNKIDLVVLNTANSVLSHQVLVNGNRIFERNSEHRVIFESNLFRDYIDNTYFLRRRYAK
jgi:uncharacterized protein